MKSPAMNSVCLLVLLAASANADVIPFQLGFTWTPVAGLTSNSGDIFSLVFTDVSNTLRITSLSATLGSGMIYDLTNTGAGYLTWGAYAVNDGGTGSTMTSAPLGEGSTGNKTGAWSFTSFTNGKTFGYTADVDEDGTCSAGLPGAICRINRDSIAPAGFMSRGGLDVTFSVLHDATGISQTYNFVGTGQTWSFNSPISTLASNTSTAFTADLATPEPSTLGLLVLGAVALGLRRRR